MELVQNAILKSKAKNTVDIYIRWYAHYQQFLRQNKMTNLESDPIAMAAFLAERVENHQAGSSVAQALSALTWAMSVRNGTSQEAQAVPAAVAAAVRRQGPAPKSKATAKLDHPKALYEDWLETSQQSLSEHG